MKTLYKGFGGVFKSFAFSSPDAKLLQSAYQGGETLRYSVTWLGLKAGELHMQIKKLPDEKEWEGPPLSMEKMVKEFRKKYKKTFRKNGRIYAKVKRKLTTPEGCLKDIIKRQYFKERVKKCRKL